MLKQASGQPMTDVNVTATGKVQKKIISDLLTGSGGREKVEGWPPNYIAFPFKSHTKNGGIRIDNAWSKVKGLIKVAQRNAGGGGSCRPALRYVQLRLFACFGTSVYCRRKAVISADRATVFSR